MRLKARYGETMKIAKVKCTLIVEVEFPDDWTEEQIRFDVEDNSCPGTHAVRAAIKKAIEHGEENGVCWACNLKGTNELEHAERT